MELAAFEDDIKGVRNLIDLALSSSISPPPHFLFPNSPAVVHSKCYPLRSPELNLLLIPPKSKWRSMLSTVSPNGSARRFS